MDIWKALNNSSLEEIKYLMSNNPGLIFEKDVEGRRVIFIAAKSGNIEIIKYLIENSIENMNVIDETKRTVLHYGVESKNLQVVKYLVEFIGLDPLAGDENQITPYELANELECKDIMDYFGQIIGVPLDEMYKNPIMRGFFPDPSVVRVEEDYYMVNSTFTYFPCITISHSKNLIDWKVIGHAITDNELADLKGLESGLGFWAPDISYYDGKFYIVATHVSRFEKGLKFKQVIVESINPEGPYTKTSIIYEDGIDPSLFCDDDGKRYMLLNRGAKIFEINKEGTQKISDTKMLWYGDYKEVPEGPHLLKHNGYYYLLVSEGGTGLGHRISIARSRNLFGPYESCPYNPILRQKDERSPIQRAGHGKFVHTHQGEWFLVYLCGRLINNKYSVLGRETALEPVEWTADGWPLVNKAKGPSVLQIRPSGMYTNKCIDKEERLIKAFSDKDYIDKNWLWVRCKSMQKHSLLSSGGVRLHGGKSKVYDLESNSIFVTRQTCHSLAFESLMRVISIADGQEAGVICYYDENSYICFGVYCIDDRFYLQVVEGIGGQEKVSYSSEIDKNYLEKIKLKVVIDKLRREFYYEVNESEMLEACTLKDLYYLSDEELDGFRFTGSMFGIYAVSRHSCSDVIADFEYFDIYNGKL